MECLPPANKNPEAQKAKTICLARGHSEVECVTALQYFLDQSSLESCPFVTLLLLLFCSSHRCTSGSSNVPAARAFLLGASAWNSLCRLSQDLLLVSFRFNCRLLHPGGPEPAPGAPTSLPYTHFSIALSWYRALAHVQGTVCLTHEFLDSLSLTFTLQVLYRVFSSHKVVLLSGDHEAPGTGSSDSSGCGRVPRSGVGRGF